MKLDLITPAPAAGLTASHQHRGPDWRPSLLLPEGDEHDDGADDDEGDDGGAEGDDGDKGKGGEEELTAEEWRAKFEAQQRVNRSLERKTRRDKAALDKLTAAQAAASKGDDDKVDPEKVREEARAEARREVLRDRVIDKIEAKAGGRFAIDPEDVAVMLLRRAEGGVEDFVSDGKVDTEAITDALAALLESNKSLAAQGGEQRFRGGADQGVRGDGKPKPLDDQIAEAMKAGDTRLALHLQNQKLVTQ